MNEVKYIPMDDRLVEILAQIVNQNAEIVKAITSPAIMAKQKEK